MISTQKFPIVVDSLRDSARMRATAIAIAAAEFEEVVGRQSHHLRQVAEGCLSAVGLPVRVGDEADRNVEGQVGRHARKTLRIERQPALLAQERVEAEQASPAENDHRKRVFGPFLLGFGVDPGDAIERAFDGAEERREKGPAVFQHVSHESAGGISGGDDQREGEGDFE